jgi:hypothetical protein
MILNMPYDFIQVLHIKRSDSTKIDYFLLIFNLPQFIYCKDKN